MGQPGPARGFNRNTRATEPAGGSQEGRRSEAGRRRRRDPARGAGRGNRRGLGSGYDAGYAAAVEDFKNAGIDTDAVLALDDEDA